MLLPAYMIDGGGDGLYTSSSTVETLTVALQNFYKGQADAAGIKARLAAEAAAKAKASAEKARLEALAKQAAQAAAKAEALNAKYNTQKTLQVDGGTIVGGTIIPANTTTPTPTVTADPTLVATARRKQALGISLNDAEAEAIGLIPPTAGTPTVTPTDTTTATVTGTSTTTVTGTSEVTSSFPQGVDGFFEQNGLVYFNGSLWTGEFNGKNYVDGKVVETPGGDGFTTVNGILMLKGKPYTGEYNGQNYIDGKVGTAVNTSTADTSVVSTSAANTSAANTSTANTSNPAFAAVNAQVEALTKQIAELVKLQTDAATKAAADAAKPKVVGVRTVRKAGGIVETVEVMSDGSAGKVIDSYKDFGARDSVMKMFQDLGLGEDLIKSMVASIDKVYADNIMPTEDQVLTAIYSSDAYNTRFAANKTIRDRMASGKGLPGDRVLTPREYIETERTYKQYMESAGLPTDFYNELNDFTNLIANAVSPDELKDRVTIAKNVLQTADANVKKALKDYYGLTDSDMVAYLLDKDKAFRAIDKRFVYSTPEAQKMYTATEVGGAALRAGITGGATKAFAEEITTAGKAAGAEEAFQTTARNQQDYARLMGLYGENAGQEDLTRQQLALAGGTEVALKTKKLASKERAKFSQRSAIDRGSLSRRLTNPDV